MSPVRRLGSRARWATRATLDFAPAAGLTSTGMRRSSARSRSARSRSPIPQAPRVDAWLHVYSDPFADPRRAITPPLRDARFGGANGWSGTRAGRSPSSCRRSRAGVRLNCDAAVQDPLPEPRSGSLRSLRYASACRSAGFRPSWRTRRGARRHHRSASVLRSRAGPVRVTIRRCARASTGLDGACASGQTGSRDLFGSRICRARGALRSWRARSLRAARQRCERWRAVATKGRPDPGPVRACRCRNRSRNLRLSP